MDSLRYATVENYIYLVDFVHLFVHVSLNLLRSPDVISFSPPVNMQMCTDEAGIIFYTRAKQDAEL